MPSYPQPLTQPITPRTAFQDIEDIDAPPLPDWLKKATGEMKAGNYSGEDTAKVFKKYKGGTGGAMNTKLLSWDRCSCTLVKSEIATTGIIHPDKQRYLSIGEMKRIASFPDAFQFPGKRKNAVERMGNSVPPMFMYHIASHIYTHILSKATLLERVEEVAHV